MSPKNLYQKPVFLPLLMISLATLLFFPIPIADASRSNDAVQFVYTSCENTSHVNLCFSTLSPYAFTIKKKSDKLAQISLSVTLSKANQTAAYITKLSRQMNSTQGSYTRAITALTRCQLPFAVVLTQLRIANKLMDNSDNPSIHISKDKLRKVITSLGLAYIFETICMGRRSDLNRVQMKPNVVTEITEVGRFISISTDLTKKLI
ncbi:hypothetical protein ACHQM5_013653 [Ranunculus cassubicifolius]